MTTRFKQYIKKKGFQLKDLSNMGMGAVLTVPADTSNQLVITVSCNFYPGKIHS